MKHLIVAFAATILAAAGIARADSVTIVGGTVELDLQSGATTAILIGPETVITGFGINPTSNTFDAGQVPSFTPSGGTNITSSGLQFINGVMFPANDRLQGSLVLTTSPFHADAVSDSLAFFRTPFSMTGTATIFDPGGSSVGSASLSGSGEATIIAQTVPGAVTSYTTQHISYQFAPQAAATPEPGTVVLLAFGLAGGLFGRRLLA